MPVYTRASLQKCPMLTFQIGFQGSVLQLGKCFILKGAAQENGCLNLSGQMTLHSAQSRGKAINADHKQNTIK